jgi:hypothetical protein
MPKRRKKKKRDLAKLFAKPKFRLVKGRHYTCQTHSMIAQLRNYASAQRLSLKLVTTDEEGVDVIRGTVKGEIE